MFSPRSKVRRLLVIWLPLSFLWVFAACVWLCADDDAEAHGTYVYHAAKNIGGSHEGEHCPIPEAPSGVLPERPSSIPAPQASGGFQAAFVLSTLPSSDALRPQALLSIPPSTSDPPLELLCILRI